MPRRKLTLKHLCLLALLQLVAGPLVLLQIVWFGTLTVREVPQHGVTRAVEKAWHNQPFQRLLAVSTNERPDGGPSLPAEKAKPVKGKIPALVWELERPVFVIASHTVIPWAQGARAWTPASPQAPPGPPPRVG